MKTVYWLLVCLTGAFYLFADFSKAVTKQYGLLLLIAALVLLVLVWKGKLKFSTAAKILLLPLAIPAVAWFYFTGFGMSFEIFGFVGPVTVLGGIYHILLALFPLCIRK